MLRLATATTLFLIEIAVIAVIYQFLVDFDCAKTDYYAACRGLRSGIVRAGVILVVLVFYLLKRRELLETLLDAARVHIGNRLFLLANFAGFATVFLPLLIFSSGGMEENAILVLLIIAVGGALMVFGLMSWCLRWRDWRDWTTADGWLLPGILLGAFFLPDIALAVQPLWEAAALNKLTFLLVYLGIDLLGVEVFARPSEFLIVVQDFAVIIAAACSGVEGLALMTGFMTIYALLMRGDLNNKRYWGVLFPIALLVSWLFNIVRIIALLLVGAFVSPEHAIEGFHSYAGWMLFTLLASVVVIIANSSQWIYRDGVRHKPPRLTEDQVAYQILPLVVFLISGVIVNTLWGTPSDGYPFQVGLMALAVAYFYRPILALEWSVDGLSIVVGLVVGLLWLAPVWGGAVAGEPPTLFWLVTRLVGTILLVPLIEELFFRGYLLNKLDLGGWPMRVLAIALPSLLFGLLHDRIIAGGLAGVAFALVKLRRDRICDPIQAHLVANAVVAAGAVLVGDYTLI